MKTYSLGDVLKKNNTIGIIHEVTNSGYNIIIGPALLYSEMNWKSDPLLQNWEKIDHIDYPTDENINKYLNPELFI